MGFWSSIGSGISSAIGAVCSGISSVVSGIGSAVSSFATSVGGLIGGIISAVPAIAGRIASFATTFLQAIGILKPKEDVEDMGERALQAKEAGITMDKFDNFDDYMDELRNFEVDPDKSAKRPRAEKIVAGLGVGTVGVENKFDMERGSFNSAWLLPISNPDYFTPDRMAQLTSTGRFQGGDVFAYLENKLSAGDKRDLQISLEKNLDGSDMSAEEKSELYEALDQAEAQYKKLGEQAQQYQPPA